MKKLAVSLICHECGNKIDVLVDGGDIDPITEQLKIGAFMCERCPGYLEIDE